MRRIRTLHLAALVLTGGLALAGCGSDDGGDAVARPTADGPLSKSDFVIEANAICAGAEEQIVAFQTDNSETGGQATGNARAELLGQITPVAQQAIDDLKALQPPPEDAAMISAGIAEMQSTLDAAQTDPTAIIDPISISNPELNDYGLTACFSAGPALEDDGTTVP